MVNPLKFKVPTTIKITRVLEVPYPIICNITA